MPSIMEALREAHASVETMRRDGEASTIREVVVRLEVDHKPCKPPLFVASYYDAEQGLTPEQAYAARVHSWHALPDAQVMRNIRETEQRTGYECRFKRRHYSPWTDDWGPKPASCPACGANLDPESYYPSSIRRPGVLPA